MKILLAILLSFPALAQGKDEIKPQQKVWTPTYVLALEIRQTRFSLDLFEHAKDAMNAAVFQIPVSKDYYEAVRVGTVISDEFRAGSLLFHGSLGNWQVKVINKAIF